MVRTRIWVCVVLCLVSGVWGQTATGQRRGTGAGPVAMVQRVRQIVAELNLTADEQTKIDAILDQARQDAAQMRGQLQDLRGQERLAKVRDFASSLKDKIEGELTPEQKLTFDQKLEDVRAEGSAALTTVLMDRFRTNLDSLNLSDDQREKAKVLLNDADEKLKAAGSDPDAGHRQAAIRDVMQEMRGKLSEFLTAEQLESLREKMQESAAEGNDRPVKRLAVASTAPSATTQPMAMMQENGESKAAAVAPAVVKPGVSAATPIESGKPAPEFKLIRLDGQPVQLSSFKGRTVVLIFGSYSCPTLRDRAAGFNKVYRETQGKVAMFLIYTSEAHPEGGWEVDRNTRDRIEVQQPSNDIARKAIARKAHDNLHLLMPILVDGMDNAVTTEYGTFPNGAVVINGDGVVVGSEQWAEPISLQHMIDEVSGEKVQ